MDMDELGVYSACFLPLIEVTQSSPPPTPRSQMLKKAATVEPTKLLVGTTVFTVEIKDGTAMIENTLLKEFILANTEAELKNIDAVMLEKLVDFKRVLAHFLTSFGHGQVVEARNSINQLTIDEGVIDLFNDCIESLTLVADVVDSD